MRTSQAYMQVVQNILKNRQDLYMAQASLGFLRFQQTIVSTSARVKYSIKF